MKCEFCGGNISIDEAFCTHCGKPNKYHASHRADMDDYEKRFSKTQDEVTETAGRFTVKTFWISFIAVLVALILGEVILLLNVDDINYTLEKKRNAKNAAAIAAELGRLEDEGKYRELGDYYNKYWVSGSNNPTFEYNIVSDVANSYSNITGSMMDIVSRDNISYQTPYDIAQKINRYLEQMYSYIKEAPEKTSNVAYSEKHISSCLDMIEECHKYLSVYLGIPFETVESFMDISSKERFNILEEYITEVLNDEE